MSITGTGLRVAAPFPDNAAMANRELQRMAHDYQRVERAIDYLVRHRAGAPGLDQLARHMGLSVDHCQRLFSRWAGISPKRFMQFLSLQHTRALLRETPSILAASNDAGLSSVSRTHDLFVHCEGVTPGEFRARGAGLALDYGIHPTPFGLCILALNRDAICTLRFIEPGDDKAAVSSLRDEFSGATLCPDPRRTAGVVGDVFARKLDPRKPLYVTVKGTNFQMKVWEALLRIPSGCLVSYHDVARWVGKPNASRAVANAIARNPVNYLIPCHRVIRRAGEFGGYQGQPVSTRKPALHAWEAAWAASEI